ncbi:signal peptide peptidase SppA [Patescibacteria group bacterium]|nr:signal peptide peptidase SppA [Patescibacteria group bacterium]
MEKHLSGLGARVLIGIVSVAVLAGAVYGIGAALIQKSYDLSRQEELPPYATSDGYSCNIAVIPVVGQLFSSEANAQAQTNSDNSSSVSAESVLQQIERAAHDDSIKGVLLRVDSPGGSATGGELIANALKRLGKPSAAVIWDQGDSAAYLASTGATKIIASPLSDVADIGVTGSYIDQSRQNKQQGLAFEKISAGEYKDVGNPNMPLTAADRAYLQANVDSMYRVFISEVASNRRMATSAVEKFANGASLTGKNALGTGLIDELGDNSTAQAWFEKEIGRDATLCE